MADKNFDNVKINVEFEEPTDREALSSGEDIKSLFGKTKKYFADMKLVAFSGSYNDLGDKPNIPTKTSELTNDSGYLTEHQDISGKVDITYVNTELSKKVDKEDGKSLLSDIDKANYDDTVGKAHTHENKTVLDEITSDKITSWNGKSDVELDDTLTDGNKAANAKVTGDKLSSLDETKLNKNVILSIINKRPMVETLDDFFALQRTQDIYQTKVYKSSYNPTPTCEKLGANAGLVCEPSTDTVEGQDDYADKIEFMWWHCNYVHDEYGNKIVTAIKGDENYSETGTVDVGTLGMTFYYSWDKSNDEYQMLSWSTSPDESLGLTPYDYSVMHDGTIRPYYVLSAYPSILGSDGLLHSQPNGKLARLQSHNNMITNYGKKGANVTGARASRNTFQIIFNLLKYGTKDSQSLYKGVTSWNFQYSAAVERDTDDTYFPVTASQANNLEVGCYVSVGYAGVSSGATTFDRGQANIHAYADDIKILRIEDMEDGNKAVYLDIDTGFTTAPVDLGNGLSSPIYISSMHMWTGETNKVIGKHDGSAVSNTNGHHSYRVQGVEYALGSYIVASDVVMDFQSDYNKNVYVAPRGVAHSTSIDTIRSTYKLVGNIPGGAGGDWYVGDIDIDTETGAWYPSLEVAGSTQGFCNKVYDGSTATSGQREYLQGGDLWAGSAAGSACVHCGGGLSYAFWGCCGCD